MTALAASSNHVAPEEREPGMLFVASGIEKTWTGRHGHTVLRGIDLELERGSATWVGGANGAGKTTLLRSLAGILMPDAGWVSLDGVDPARDPRVYRRRTGFLSAGDRGLHARLTVRRHLHYWAKLVYLPRSERDRAVDEAVTLLDLEPLVDKRVDRLSMGQRQRVRLAMVLLHKPDLAFLDEPRNSLDDAGYAALDDAVRSILGRGGAVLWCSPRVEDGSMQFDHEYVLVDGLLEEMS